MSNGFGTELAMELLVHFDGFLVDVGHRIYMRDNFLSIEIFQKKSKDMRLNLI